jgi:3-oxocholest-4-en-26-oyl-CoA dehydrogenase beta subunit
MDFRPSSAQQLLISTAREFLRNHCPPETAQRIALDPRGFDASLWRRMAELGWQGLLVPADLGGSDGSLLDVILLMEELGRVGAPGPFVPSAVVATLTLRLVAGGDDQKKRWLPAMAAGERIVSVALAETGNTLELDRHGRLNGRALFVEAAHVADALIVAARGDGARSLALLPTNRPGVTRQAQESIGPEKLFAVTCEAVSLTAADILDPEAGFEALQAGALARTAEMVGAAQRVLELAVEYAKTRVQGGRPIGAHQAIQHACADLVRDVDASRGLLYAAAWKVSEGLPAAVDIAMAKAYASEACLTVARRGHQIFGAIGYCEEHPLHLLHKRILAASLDCGDVSQHLEHVAHAIGLKA